MRSIAVLSVFALVTSTTYLSGQQSAATTPVKPAAASQDYSAESVVVEQLNNVYRFAADGTGTRETTAVIRIQSDAAARQYGVIDFSFAGNSERVDIDYVRVRKPDGTLVETPAAEALEMPQEVTRQAPFYSDLKQKQIPIRNLRMGDKLEYKVRVVDTSAEVPGQFWGQESFGLWAVILNQSIELHVPKTKYVKVWSPTAQPTKTDSGEETVYRWTSSQLTPVAPKDSLLKHREFDPKGEYPTIAWTTFKSWDEVGSWYRSLEADRIVPDASVKAKVAELTAGKTTDEEKARALYNYVATQIRYIGVAFGIGRYQPHPAAEVMRNQYGDCKDKHTLLAAMLTAAGVHSSASMIGAGIRLNEEVPAPSAFNHMITMVPLNGKQVWVDTTAEVAPWGMLVATTRDKETLVVPDSGTPKLEKTPQALPFPLVSQFESRGTLSKEGTMKAKIEYTARGDDEILLRVLLRQVPPGQWDELSQRLAQSMGFSGNTSHTEASNPDKTDTPVHISYDYEHEKNADWADHRIVAHMPPLFIENVDEKYPPKKYAIQLGEPHVETAISVIKLPVGWGAQLPEAVHQKTPYITLDKTYKVEGDTVTVERRFEVLQREFPAAEWKSYKKWYDAAIGDGEPYINLISTESKTASGSATPAMPSQEISVVMRAFYEQVQRGELNAAEQSMLQIQKIEPDSVWYYRCLYQLMAMKGKPEETADALRHVLKTNNAIDAEKKVAAEIFYNFGHYDEALPLLETQSAADPENETLKLRLGISQIKTGSASVGSKALVALLDKTTEELIMNDAAYQLAEANIELDKAEKAARSVVDTLSTESTSWVVGGAATKIQNQRQSLLLASWDTLGWVLYRQGRLAEAENYIRAAWNNDQRPEIGLHLGEIEEKLGNNAAAMSIYEIALSSIPPDSLGTVAPSIKQNKQKLTDHIAALKKQGVPTQSATPYNALQKMRTLKLGLWKGKNALAEYAFTIEKDKTGDLQESDPGAAPIVGANAMIRKATFSHWIPTGSQAHLLRKGTLNCHGGVCELVVHAM